MIAAVYTKYGGPEQLALAQLPNPVPKEDEVLVKVRAVAVNDWDWQLLLGKPFVNRLINGLSRPKRQILGSDIAGTVEAAGNKVSRFRPGDEVYGDLSNHWGGFAQYVCAPEQALAHKPPEMSFTEAAAIPQAGMLAVQGLIDYGRPYLTAGSRVLINGAGGGVGTFAVQIAKEYGIELTGVDNTEKLEMLRHLGYHHVIDYTREDFTRSGKQYDLILDNKTNRPISAYARVLKKGGLYMALGGSGKIMQIPLFGPLLSVVTGKKYRLLVLKINKDLEFFNQHYRNGSIKPVIGGTYMLKDIRDAFTLFSEGRHKGKIVLEVEHE